VPQTLAKPQPQAHALIRQPAVTRSWEAPAPLRLWHLTSFDAPTVAVVWSLSFAWAAGVVLPPWLPLLLALVTWTVYVADRLLDARAALRAGTIHRLRQRHRFHWRHRRILIPLALAACCAAFAMVVALMSPTIRERNTVLAAAAIVYLTRVHSRPGLLTSRPARLRLLLLRFPLKELVVALLFTAACALPVFSRLPATNTAWPLAATVAFFSLLAFVNCHAIEQWECAASQHSVSGNDFSHSSGTLESRRASRSAKPFGSNLQMCQGTTSVVPQMRQNSDRVLTPDGRTLHVLATNTTFLFAFFLALIGLATAALLFPSQPRPAALLVMGAASALLLTLLDLTRNRITPLALRAAADLVLLSPLALLVR
jgi:hypothetical protein